MCHVKSQDKLAATVIEGSLYDSRYLQCCQACFCQKEVLLYKKRWSSGEEEGAHMCSDLHTRGACLQHA